MISPDFPRGHFALGTLSETCFEDVVFEVNVRQQNLTKISEIKNVKLDMEIKIRIISRYYFGAINTL